MLGPTGPGPCSLEAQKKLGWALNKSKAQNNFFSFSFYSFFSSFALHTQAIYNYTHVSFDH
jgi:hypothetical protein